MRGATDGRRRDFYDVGGDGGNGGRLPASGACTRAAVAVTISNYLLLRGRRREFSSRPGGGGGTRSTTRAFLGILSCRASSPGRLLTRSVVRAYSFCSFTFAGCHRRPGIFKRPAGPSSKNRATEPVGLLVATIPPHRTQIYKKSPTLSSNFKRSRARLSLR